MYIYLNMFVCVCVGVDFQRVPNKMVVCCTFELWLLEEESH
jgi:hypothetical protein